MNNGITMRHVVTMAGTVRDQVNNRRLGNALVEIIEGPPAFYAIRQALQADPAWQTRPERFDRTWSHADGIFLFVDLPVGVNYRLRVTIPSLGTQYGLVETAFLAVEEPSAQQPFPVTQADVKLPPTRIHGVVIDLASSDPIKGARVRLQGDTQIATTLDDGSYELRHLVQGAPTLEVRAVKFATALKPIELVAGQDRTEDFQLQPL